MAKALGLEHTRVDVRSRLADATVWIAGSDRTGAWTAWVS